MLSKSIILDRCIQIISGVTLLHKQAQNRWHITKENNIMHKTELKCLQTSSLIPENPEKFPGIKMIIALFLNRKKYHICVFPLFLIEYRYSGSKSSSILCYY